MKNIFVILLVLVSFAFTDNWIRVSTYEARNKINPEVSVLVRDTIDTVTGWPTPDTSFLYIYTYKIKAKPYPREHDYWYVSYFDTVNKVYRTEKVDSGPSNYTQNIENIVFELPDTIVPKKSIKWNVGIWMVTVRKFEKWKYSIWGRWSRLDSSYTNILPGDSLTLIFVSKGLPSISKMHFVGDCRGDDPIKVVYGYTDYEFPEEVFADPYGGRALYTVLPWPAPVPDPFYNRLTITQGQLMIDTLKSWIDQSVQLGWLDEKLSDRLKLRLDAVEKYIWTGRGENHAKQALNTFMKTVERERGDLVKDEAYFVLYYNAKYLLKYLPQGGPQ